jgi:hypothetical protein
MTKTVTWSETEFGILLTRARSQNPERREGGGWNYEAAIYSWVGETNRSNFGVA